MSEILQGVYTTLDGDEIKELSWYSSLEEAQRSAEEFLVEEVHHGRFNRIYILAVCGFVENDDFVG